MDLEVLLLDDRIHDRDSFQCRDESLNNFIKTKANQEHKKFISDTYVITESSLPQTVLGYFTLSNSSVSLSNLPHEYKRRLPGYPNIGTTLLGRMARDIQTPAGFGEIILKEAIKKSLERGTYYALEVVAKNDQLIKYYESWGFINFLDDKNHLFLARATIEELVNDK